MNCERGKLSFNIFNHIFLQLVPNLNQKLRFSTFLCNKKQNNEQVSKNRKRIRVSEFNLRLFTLTFEHSNKYLDCCNFVKENRTTINLDSLWSSKRLLSNCSKIHSMCFILIKDFYIALDGQRSEGTFFSQKLSRYVKMLKKFFPWLNLR